MKKLFISQPMNRRSDEEILADREHILEIVEAKFGEKFELIDSFIQNAPHDAKPLWFLGKSLELLSNADLAVFGRGWQNARGCRIEHECAIEYGLKVMYIVKG